MIRPYKICLFSLLVSSSLCQPAFALPSCLPQEGDFRLLSDYQENGQIYSHYFGSDSGNINGSFLTLEIGNSCEVLFSPDLENPSVLILDSYLPVDVARNLYLNRYRGAIEAIGGLEAYQKAVDSAEGTIEEPFTYISPAEEWALLELGVKLPDDRVIASIDPEEERIYRLLDSTGSPAFGADSIENIRFSSDYILASFFQDRTENLVFAKLLEDGGIEYIFSGPEEDYNPEMLSYEHQIPLSIFEVFEE